MINKNRPYLVRGRDEKIVVHVVSKNVIEWTHGSGF